MSDPPGKEQQAAVQRKWDAELERRGVAAVAAYLASDKVGTTQNAIIPLYIGHPDPERAYVEAWLGRKEDDAAQLAEARHQESLAVGQNAVKWAFWAFVAAVVGVLVALFK